MRRIVLILLLILSGIEAISGQTRQSKPAFEVTSVKPYSEGNDRADFSGFLSHPGGHFHVAGVDLKMLITYAYRLRDEQIVGGPAWVSSALWEVSAKAEDSSVPATPTTFDPAVPDAMALMVQSLIEDRFHLISHREVKELSTYDLIISKGGPKIQKAKDQAPSIPGQPTKEPSPTRKSGNSPPSPPRGALNMFNSPSGSTLQGAAIPLSYLANGLAISLRRAVVDRTNLTGLYDFKLQWAQDPMMLGITASGGANRSSAPSGPSIFTAVQEQLGLKLESSKGPVEVLVIDSLSKPTEN
jgi:uncharacterized protein (TIGR03435 family)